MACTCLPGPSVLARQLREASRLSSSAARSCMQGRQAQPRVHDRAGCLVCGSMTQKYEQAHFLLRSGALKTMAASHGLRLHRSEQQECVLLQFARSTHRPGDPAI